MPATALKTIFTVGHSTRSIEDFIALLHAHGVRAVADVRLIPRSRRLPHFNDESLTLSLPTARLAYHPFKSLGGRRRPLKDSVNTAWRNDSFRGYADFMQTPAFAAALEQLTELAADVPTTTMCAEAVPWRCHRSMIADALIVRGWTVMDIMSERSAVVHKLTPFAKVAGTTITYPAAVEQGSLFGADQLKREGFE
jgi:uncharacterized protein (DUF488 family)